MSAARAAKIDELMEKASEALAQTSYFEAERLASKAMEMAHAGREYEHMARIVLPLQEARRQRLQLALDTDAVVVVQHEITEEMEVGPGCYLVQPPQVGADARRLRLLALRREVPLAVVCREPLTQLRMWPVVAICPGLTVRTPIEPPDDEDAVDLAWFAGALEELGDWSLESMDDSMPVTRRIEALLQRLDAVPEHEGLHQVLGDACREAAEEAAEQVT